MANETEIATDIEAMADSVQQTLSQSGEGSEA
jgi:hypothetical protein